MKIVDYDRIGIAAPLNATAATVRDGSGEHWDGRVSHTALHWADRPPLRVLTPCELNNNAINGLLGLRKGRFTCIGVLDYAALGIVRGKDAKLPFVCRCDCGEFEVRSPKALRNPLNDDDMCGKCAHLRSLQYRYAKGATKATRRDDETRLEALATGGRR